MGAESLIPVEVAYALPNEQIIIAVQVSQGTTVLQAIEKSGILERYPEINLEQNKLGIFGKLTKADVVLKSRDRVEIYRPLLADPKEVRKRRAEQKKNEENGES